MTDIKKLKEIEEVFGEIRYCNRRCETLIDAIEENKSNIFDVELRLADEKDEDEKQHLQLIINAYKEWQNDMFSQLASCRKLASKVDEVLHDLLK